jgi:hypothetical protein
MYRRRPFQGIGQPLSIAFILLLVSIVVVSPLAIHDGVVAQSVIAALAAAALAATGISARAADVNYAAQVTRRLKLAAAVPAIWMVVQILPMPFWSHSIWINANEALNQQSWGHVSVDVGRTIAALAFYLANVSLIVVSLFVAGDRRRAELILLTLTVVTSLATIALLAIRLTAGSADINDMLSGVASLGIILSLASGVRAVERYESRRPETASQNIQMALIASGAGLLACIAGLIAGATLNVALTVVFGVVAFGAIQAIRWAGLGSWAMSAFVATLIAAAVMVVLWRYDSLRALSPFLQFATGTSPKAISVAQRILSDTGWQGAGGATYSQLLPIYQELGSSVTKAPSTAAAFAFELGWPMTLFIVATTIGLVVTLFHGALVRGRDSFFPAAAAASAIIVLCQAFCDTSLLNSGVAVISAAVIGLGLAQSVSHRERP